MADFLFFPVDFCYDLYLLNYYAFLLIFFPTFFAALNYDNFNFALSTAGSMNNEQTY